MGEKTVVPIQKLSFEDGVWTPYYGPAVGVIIVDPPPDPDPDPTDFIVGVTKPSATNTGTGFNRDSFGNIIVVAKPVTVHNGNYTVTTSNQTLQNLIINNGCIIINNGVANTKIRNVTVRIPGNDGGVEREGIETQNGTNTVIEFCEIYSLSPGNAGCNGIGFKNYTAFRNNVHHVTDGLRVHTYGDNGGPANVIMEGNYVHDLISRNPDPLYNRSDFKTHSDCVEIEGGSNIIVRGNLFAAYHSTDYGSNVTWTYSASPYYPAPVGASGARVSPQTTSCMMIVRNTGTLSGLVIEDNWMYGGFIALNMGNSGNSTTDAVVNRNKFNRDQFHAGHTIDIDVTGTGIITGTGANANIYEDGGAITIRRNA